MCGALTPGSECRVVRGMTSILLDTSPDGVAEEAYHVMERVLDDMAVLDEFLRSPLLHSEFVRRIGENLVVVQEPDKQGDTEDKKGGIGTVARIAITSATISFLLTGLVLFCLTRRQKKVEEKAKMRMAYYYAKRRKFWSQLQEDEDQQTYPGLMMTDPAPMQTVTWSVSDLTSESNSIKSVLKMDCIEEEHEEGSNDSRANDLEQPEEAKEEEPSFDDLYEELEPRGSSSHLPRPSLEIPPFVAHWQDDHSELATRGSSTCKNNLSDRVWELAALPKSHWDESDPEAPTPECSPAKFRSPVGGVFLRDSSGEESYVDHELNFSADYTSDDDEEETQRGSSSPATTATRSSGRFTEDPSSSGNSSYQADAENDSTGTPLLGDSMTLTNHANTSLLPVDPPETTEQESGTCDNDAAHDKTSTTKDSTKDLVVVETASLTSSGSEVTNQAKEIATSSSPDVSQDESTVTDCGSSTSTIFTSKAEVFYTPQQQQQQKPSTAQPDAALAMVAQTIVSESGIYDAATRRWAQRVLAEMRSPTPKLLAAEPYVESLVGDEQELS